MSYISMKDIAEMCGVSTATVSRVINKNGRFSKETEEKVFKAIEETGFQVNFNAKSLRINKSFIIGILIPDITNHFYADLSNRIERICFKNNFSTIISSTYYNQYEESLSLQAMISQGVDGIIVVSGADDFYFDQKNSNIPYVCIDRQLKNANSASFISSDHFQGGYLAGKELIEQGCTSPLILIGDENYATNLRIQGFEASCQEHDIKFSPTSHIVNINELSDLLLKKLSFDAIFAANDYYAMKAIRLLWNKSISIPEQVKIVGFDDFPYSELFVPSISTIRQNTQKIAEIAVQTLIQQINSSDFSDYKKKLINVSLISRESSQHAL